MRSAVLAGSIVLLAAASQSSAQELVTVVEGIAQRIASTVAAAGFGSVAVVDPLGPNSEATAFGRFLAEELSGALVNARGVRVVDRLSLQRILSEQQLSVSGLVNDASAVQRIGDLAGVQVLILGTYFVLGNSIRLSLKGLNVQTAEAIAAVNTTVGLDASVAALLAVSIPTPAGNGALDGPPVAPTTSASELSSNVTYDPETRSYFIYDLCTTTATIETSSDQNYSSIHFAVESNQYIEYAIEVLVGDITVHTREANQLASRAATVDASIGLHPGGTPALVRILADRRDCNGVLTLTDLELR